MAPDYDDDDVIEDYNEITDNSGARRVSSGKGGPVRRPTDGVRPSTTAMQALGDPDDPDYEGPPKGKISHGSAKMIWIICIVIVLLGVGAVLADIVFDLRGTKQPVNTTAANTPATNRGGGSTRRELSPEEKAQKDFLRAVASHMTGMDSSKAWDLYFVSFLEFDASYDKLIATRNKDGATDEELDAAYADTIKYYYKAKYMSVLFTTHHDHEGISKEYMSIDVHGDDVKTLSSGELKNTYIHKYQAAVSKVSNKSAQVNRFKTDFLKFEVRAQNVHQNEEWKANVFGEWKAKWDAASGTPPVYDQKDVDFMNEPDYASSETKLWQKFREANKPN